MKEKLKELEDEYFMLQMQDVWDSEDYRYAEYLREQIKKTKRCDKNENVL